MSLFSLEPVQKLSLPLPTTVAETEALPVPRLQYFAPGVANGTEPAGAVIVCPGGGYARRAPHEGAPVAERFAALGFHAFLLDYRVAPHRHPLPLKDAATAVAFVRKNAAQFNVNPEKIAILGFSAGGHLAASLGVYFKEAEALLEPSLAGTSPRPDALLLAYTVINSHTGSVNNLYGPDAGEEAHARFRLDSHVSPQTPPTFFWHTLEDKTVDVENPYAFARALRLNDISYELHIFPHGPHGLGLSDENMAKRYGLDMEKYSEVRVWPELAATWLRKQGW